MKTNEQAANEYSNKRCSEITQDQQQNFDEIKRAFLEGIKFANQWHEIDRDITGFATDKCINEILEHDHVILLDRCLDIAVVGSNTGDWMREIENNPDYTDWRTVDIY